MGERGAAALANGQPANIVIGQPDFFSTTCNNGGISAASLCGPAGVAVDSSGNLYVSDNGNNRILEYNTPFVHTGATGAGDAVADQVFGQQGDFTANMCNQGAGTAATAQTLCSPTGIAIDGTGVLYIADNGNNRIIEYLFPSIEIAADDVFGQLGHFNTTQCNRGLASADADSLCGPSGMAIDSFNNLYVADSGNNRVLEYNNPPTDDTTANRVFGQAGNFSKSACNSGGAAPTTATLCAPGGVALDTANRLYISDDRNSRVLEYNTPLLSANASKVFGQPMMTTAACNDGGVTNAAGLCRPDAVALDVLGNLFVADAVNNRVVKYNSAATSDTIADVVLGQPDFAHSDPNAVDASSFGGGGSGAVVAGLLDIGAMGGVAIDNSASPPRLYVADTQNNRVLGFNNVTALVNGTAASVVIGQTIFTSGSSTACFGNAPTASNLCEPTSVAVDVQGNLYVADSSNSRVLKFLAPITTGKAASLVIGQPNFMSKQCNGGGTATKATLCAPWGVAVDSGENIYVADHSNNRVLEYLKPAASHPNAAQVIGQLGSFSTSACNEGGLSQFSLCGPTGVAVDSMGRLFVADFNNNRVLEYNKPFTLPEAEVVVGQGATGANFTAKACNNGGIGAATLCHPTDAAIDGGNHLYIADAGNNRILEYNGSLASVTANVVFGQGGFFITNNANLGGTAPSAATLSLPLWLAVDKAGNLYAADGDNNRVLQYEAPLGVPSPTPTPGMATVSPSTGIKFGNVATGNTSPVRKATLTNTGAGTIIINAVNRAGSNPTDFAQNNNCVGTLGGGKSCTINITFTPSAAAGTPEAAQLIIYDNAKNAPQTLPVYGTSALPATLAPASLNFGNVAVANTSVAQSLKLTNNRSTVLTISSITLSGANPGDFLKTTTCGASLAAFASCIISVKFKPAALGSRSANVIIKDNPGNLQQSALLKGTGALQVTVAPTSLSFGSVTHGTTSAAKLVTVTNNQSATLTISTSLSGTNPGDFLKTTTCGASLAAFASCTVSVKFKPATTGARSATLTVTDSPDTGSPHKVSLSGTGL
jgi:hypothetical protein